MYEVPKSNRDLPTNQFRFKLPYTDQVFSIPKLGFVPHEVAERADELSKVEIVGVAMALELTDVVEALKALDGLEIANLMVAWYKESGISMGESVASATSSPSTQGPSDTTSSPSDVPSIL